MASRPSSANTAARETGDGKVHGVAATSNFRGDDGSAGAVVVTTLGGVAARRALPRHERTTTTTPTTMTSTTKPATNRRRRYTPRCRSNRRRLGRCVIIETIGLCAA
jgi:hypothetical protein